MHLGAQNVLGCTLEDLNVPKTIAEVFASNIKKINTFCSV